MIEIIVILFVCIIAIIVVYMRPEFGPIFVGVFTTTLIGASLASAVKCRENLEPAPVAAPPATKDDAAPTNGDAAAPKADTAVAPAPEFPPSELYDDNYAKWDSYRFLPAQCGAPVVYSDCSETSRDANVRITEVARSRARDKRCIDGLVTKDANFYRYHYAGELDEVEKKPWWGRRDI